MSMYVPRKLCGGWPSSAVRSQESAVFHSTLLVKRPHSLFGQTYVTAHSTPVVSRAEMLNCDELIVETEPLAERVMRFANGAFGLIVAALPRTKLEPWPRALVSRMNWAPSPTRPSIVP